MVLLAALAGGCNASTKSDEAPRSCVNDGDCAPDQECRALASLQQPIPFNPCATLMACSSGSMCGSGMVCAPYVPMAGSGFNCPARVCTARCTEVGCQTGQVCGDDGICRVPRCDEADAAPCSAHYRCDPAAASMPVLVLQGSSVTDTVDPNQQALRGCVRKRCDEPDGFTCRELWTCEPSLATAEASGCLPTPCQETGRCSNDSGYICEPNAGPHPDFMDPHGCVLRNCAEGHVCEFVRESVNYGYCDVDSDAADERGCRVRTCEEAPDICAESQVCDLGSSVDDSVGCRHRMCSDPGGPECPNGTACELNPGSTDTYACRAPTSGTGGAGGVSSTGGTGNAPSRGGSAGTSTGGTGGVSLVPATGGRSTAGAPPATGGNASGGSNGANPAPEAESGLCVPRE